MTRLDRLVRSTRDLLNTLAQIAEKGAGFRSLGDTYGADTRTPHGRLPEAIVAVFPEATVQTCIVHLLRHGLDFVSYEDRKAVATALKGAYRAKARLMVKPRWGPSRLASGAENIPRSARASEGRSPVASAISTPRPRLFPGETLLQPAEPPRNPCPGG